MFNRFVGNQYTEVATNNNNILNYRSLEITTVKNTVLNNR